MKKLSLTFLSGLGIVALMAPAAKAQTVYGIESGVTSMRFDKDAVDNLGFQIEGAANTVQPAPDYEIGFNIGSSTNPKDHFCFTIEPFVPGEGIIAHTGTIEFTGGISIGNFEVAFDASRLSLEKSGFFVTDQADFPGQILFDIGVPASDVINATEFTINEADILVAPEFATLLNDAGLVGSDIGDLRVDALVGAKPIPEPSAAFLSLLGGMFLVFRRKRT